MSGQLSEAVLARLRPSRLLSAHYYVLIFPLLMGAVSSLLGYFPGTLVDPSLRLELSVGLAGLSFLFYLVSEFRRLSHRYTIYDQRVGIAEGILRKRVQYMPYSRVERIEVNQSLIGRIFGIGNIIVDTGDDHVTLRAIRSPSKVERLVSHQLRGTGTGFPSTFRQPA
ncbi:MAG TPA: PH domain-containing protein [Candidatus Bathyarchaeia archaeon]|nr:PH domain-containing protein [Candidatus Bathyarchaeia archaeon]